MNTKWLYLILFISVNCFAVSISSAPDKTAQDVENWVDQNIMIDNQVALGKTIGKSASDLKKIDSLSSTRRLYLQFDQSQKIADDLESQMNTYNKNYEHSH